MTSVFFMFQLSSDEKDVFQEELVGAFFKEDGLVLDSKEALPLAYHYAITCIPKAGNRGTSKIPV